MKYSCLGDRRGNKAWGCLSTTERVQFMGETLLTQIKGRLCEKERKKRKREEEGREESGGARRSGSKKRTYVLNLSG